MVLLVGETTAAREISQHLLARGIEHLRVLPKEESVTLIRGDGELLKQGPYPALSRWVETFGCRIVINASHPSTGTSLNSLRLYCEQKGIPFARLERPETKLPVSPLVHPVNSWEEALACLEERAGAILKEARRPTVFITTGSHKLDSLTTGPIARIARLVVRVLPEGRLVQKCQDLGIAPRDILAMQGPFSKEVNRALFKFYGADILLTRDSGAAGGTDSKISAALALGMEIVLLKRAAAPAGFTVHSVRETISWLNGVHSQF